MNSDPSGCLSIRCSDTYVNVLVCFNTSQSPIHEMDNGRRLDDGIHTWVRFGWVRSQNFVLRWVVAKKILFTDFTQLRIRE